MQYHFMNIISNTVDTASQPVFVLTKELMIQFPEKFGPDKYFCLFRSLHKKNLLLIICSQVIKGSELDEIICTCCLSIDGADYWETVNNIKRARYCLQVGTYVIYLKLKQAHMDSESDELILSWLANKRKINEMCFYRTLILKLMISLLVFIRFLWGA